MNLHEFLDLKRGDIIQHIWSGDSYIVTDVLDGNVYLVRTIVAIHANEWHHVRSVEQEHIEDKLDRLYRIESAINTMPNQSLANDLRRILNGE